MCARAICMLGVGDNEVVNYTPNLAFVPAEGQMVRCVGRERRLGWPGPKPYSPGCVTHVPERWINSIQGVNGKQDLRYCSGKCEDDFESGLNEWCRWCRHGSRGKKHNFLSTRKSLKFYIMYIGGETRLFSNTFSEFNDKVFAKKQAFSSIWFKTLGTQLDYR